MSPSQPHTHLGTLLLPPGQWLADRTLPGVHVIAMAGGRSAARDPPSSFSINNTEETQHRSNFANQESSCHSYDHRVSAALPSQSPSFDPSSFIRFDQRTSPAIHPLPPGFKVCDALLLLNYGAHRRVAHPISLGALFRDASFFGHFHTSNQTLHHRRILVPIKHPQHGTHGSHCSRDQSDLRPRQLN